MGLLDRGVARDSRTGVLMAQVRLCRYRFSVPVKLGYKGDKGRGRVGYRFTVYKRTLPPAPSRGWVLLLIIRVVNKKLLLVIFNPKPSCALESKPVGKAGSKI